MGKKVVDMRNEFGLAGKKMFFNQWVVWKAEMLMSLLTQVSNRSEQRKNGFGGAEDFDRIPEIFRI